MPESTTPPPGIEQLLLPWQAAKLCGVTVHTLARWTREGRLSYIFLPGGHRRYRAGDVLAMRTDVPKLQNSPVEKENGNG